MSFTIRERCQKVAECVSNKGLATIESIAKVTGCSPLSICDGDTTYSEGAEAIPSYRIGPEVSTLVTYLLRNY